METNEDIIKINSTTYINLKDLIKFYYDEQEDMDTHFRIVDLSKSECYTDSRLDRDHVYIFQMSDGTEIRTRRLNKGIPLQIFEYLEKKENIRSSL
ncbi:MAG: hypothetical protein MJY89_06230 [Bacteroidales bacterium]|nr:hypothetical protein [Bacteroidales bacterium]